MMRSLMVLAVLLTAVPLHASAQTVDNNGSIGRVPNTTRCRRRSR